MRSINKFLFIAQFLILFGAISIFYKIGYQIDLKNKQDIANVAISSFENEFNSMLTHSELILTHWIADTKHINSIDSFCDETIINEIANNPLFISYGVGDLEGNVVCSKNKLPEGFNLKNATPKYQEVIDDKDFKVTDFRYNVVTKEPAISVGKPLLNKKGEVTNVFYLVLRLKTFNQELDNLVLPINAKLFITDDKGVVEIISPYNENYVGKNYLSSEIFSLILAQKEGHTEFGSKDGKKHLYTYKPLVINDNQEKISFIILEIERDYNVFNIPDFYTKIQITLLSISILLLSVIFYTIYMSNKDVKKTSNNRA